MNTNDVVRDFIVKELVKGNLDTPLTEEDDLIESGILDSLGIMSLLIFLEEHFSLKIPEQELIPENFSSIGAISSLVSRQMSN
jgi:acyl carrier protein